MREAVQEIADPHCRGRHRNLRGHASRQDHSDGVLEAAVARPGRDLRSLSRAVSIVPLPRQMAVERYSGETVSTRAVGLLASMVLLYTAHPAPGWPTRFRRQSPQGRSLPSAKGSMLISRH